MAFFLNHIVKSIFCHAILCAVLVLNSLTVASQQPEDTTSASDSTESIYDSYQNESDADNQAVNQKDTVIMRAVPDSVVRHMQNDKKFAYANEADYWVIPKPKKGFWDYFFEFFASDFVRVIVYIIMASVILFALYRIVLMNKLFIFYSSKKGKPSAEDAEETDISDDLDEKIQSAVASGEYRFGVRYLYLKALRELNAKGWIKYHRQATNHDYTMQMSRIPVSKNFQFLTHIYEYVWYGEFDLSKQQFDIVENNFQHFYNKIQS